MHGVVSGLDRLLAEGPAVAGLSEASRIGLLAHPASVNRQARHALELFCESPSWIPARLFAPEHGLWGREQDMEGVAHGVEPHSGLPIVSLYGAEEASLRPTAAQLADLDAVVVDLQDVGSRYYTFVYTMAFVMEAAAPAGIPVVVLDRPNPIGGELVEGPVLEPAWRSFVGRYPLPVRHGMTAGELARWFNERHQIGADLRVIEMRGWHRATDFRGSGLPWVPPSPNMPTPATALVYPGGCLLEGTNLSEGRGTTSPFELVGAPWLDGSALAAALADRQLPGVLFRVAGFRPMFQKHADKGCGGVQVIVTDPRSFRPFVTYLALVQEARRLAPNHFDWRREVYEFETERLAIDLLLGRGDLRELLEAGASSVEMEATWRAGLDAFREERREFLLYD